ncbi:MAG: peptidylprolyl isomerase [Chloroflexota bacterium]
MSNSKGVFPLLKTVFWAAALAIFGVACAQSDPVDLSDVTPAAVVIEETIEQPTDIPTRTPIPPTPTATPIPPTPTPPLAALVNGGMITLAEYEADLQQYTQTMAAIGESLPENYQRLRLMTLIEQEIIQQAAVEWGITISEDELNVALEDIKQRAEATGGYDAWLRANQYTADQFPALLRNQLLTSAVVEQIVRDVPTAVEQVRARYLVVNDAALAQSLLDQARGGANFADLAVTYSLDQATAPEGGDLDFIIRGWLFQPAVEDAIFAGELNQVSDIITVDLGNGQINYYLVQVIERDPARPLTSTQRDLMTKRVIEEWLGERLATAEIIEFE